MTKVALAVVVCFLASTSAKGKIWEVRPEEDYRAILRKLQPGDELVLHEGIYDGAAEIRVSGAAKAPIIIRGHGGGESRPILNWEGTSANLWQISGEHLLVRHLEFRPRHTYAIRIGRATGITIEDCVFRDCGGGDISANSAPVDGLRILRNQFLGSRRTPIYIGNHDGKLAITGFVFESNVIDGSQVNGQDTIGYGIQLKLNVTGGVIRNNFIKNTKGPGIMVYGATNAVAEAANLVERNIVTGSRRNPGIVVGGGPSMVRDNLVVSCPSGGISIINYGGRNLLREIVVRGNTSLANEHFDFSFATPVQRTLIENNRAFFRSGATAFRNLPIAETKTENLREAASSDLIRLADKFQNLLPTPSVLEKALQSSRPGALSPDTITSLFELLSSE